MILKSGIELDPIESARRDPQMAVIEDHHGHGQETRNLQID